MTVRYLGFFEQGSSLHAVAVPAISDQRPGVAPFCRALLSIGGEQRRQVSVPIQGKKTAREKIAVALVIVWIQAQEFPIVLNGFVVAPVRGAKPRATIYALFRAVLA